MASESHTEENRSPHSMWMARGQLHGGHGIQGLASGMGTEQNPKAVCSSKGPAEAAHRVNPDLPSGRWQQHLQSREAGVSRRIRKE